MESATAATKPGSKFIPPNWVLYGLIAGVLMECIGGYWDVWWHVHQGRETFWTPPHTVLYSGAVTLGIFGGIGGVKALQALRADLKSLGRKFSLLMAFAVPTGYLIIVAGISVQIASAPFDDAWHVMLAAEGKPDVFYTPPHLMATLGGVIAFAGLLVEAVRCQRLALGPDYASGGFRDPNKMNFYDVAIFVGIGTLWMGLTFIFTPIDFPYGWVTLRGIAVQGLMMGIAGTLALRLLRFPGAFLLAGAPFLIIHSVFRDGALFIPAFLAGVAAFDLLAYQLEVRKWVSPVLLASLPAGLLLGTMLFLIPLPLGPNVAWPEMATVAGLPLIDMYMLDRQPVVQIAMAIGACTFACLFGAILGELAARRAVNGVAGAASASPSRA
jgi:hypothetical protein